MISSQGNTNNWDISDIQMFWGEIAPCDHLVQIYDNEYTFLNTLEGFAGDGFIRGESVIIIATPDHIEALNQRLISHGFDIQTLIANDLYVTLDATEAASKIMVNNWPDEDLFTHFVTSVMTRAAKKTHKVRVFGEIVSVLWSQGHTGATVQLENLWHRLLNKDPFCLFCAYPKSGFTQDAASSIDTICKTHSKVIDGSARPSTELYYMNVI